VTAPEPLAARLPRHTPPVWKAFLGSVWPLLVGLTFAYVMHMQIAPMVGDYYGRILVDVGIAIVLSVSLNIVNGFGGQFSLGHAGFMLVGTPPRRSSTTARSSGSA
jgi:branched-chain amino acid transport system permease protein